MSVNYSTGELAQAFGMTNEGIRHLEKQGIISSHRAENDYREFNHDQFIRLRRYKTLQMLGFDNREILRMINSDYTLDECTEAYESNLKRIREKKRLLDEAEKDICEKLRSIRILEAGEAAWDIVTPEPFVFRIRKKNGEPLKDCAFDTKYESRGEMKMLAVYTRAGDELKGSVFPEGVSAAEDVNIVTCRPGRCVHGAVSAIKFRKPDLAHIFSWMQEHSLTPTGDVYCFMNLSYRGSGEEGIIVHEFYAPIADG